MARPAEKARAMMNKWTAMREADNKSAPARRRRRPHLASECYNLADAERFRNQIIREITEGISTIQNPGLGEHELRELNDKINQNMRHKWHWNKRIRELGGSDYNDIERQRQIEEGGSQYAAQPSGAGYRYFGAAKDLPGVRELLQKQEQKLQKKKQKSNHYVTPDYYGWRDEEDGVLLELEAVADKKHKKRRVVQTQDDYLDIVPTQAEMDQMLLEVKKKALLAKYNL
jgi:pre-mRNA-splicing factor ISY1